MWSSFSRKQALAGPLQESYSKQLFEKLPERPTNVLKKDFTTDVSVRIFQKFRSSYFFKIQIRTPLDGWTWILKYKLEHWGVLNINVLFYKKKIRKAKLIFSNSDADSDANSDAEMLMLRFSKSNIKLKKAVKNTYAVIFLLTFSYIMLPNWFDGRLGTVHVSVPQNSSIGQSFSLELVDCPELKHSKQQ